MGKIWFDRSTNNGYTSGEKYEDIDTSIDEDVP